MLLFMALCEICDRAGSSGPEKNLIFGEAVSSQMLPGHLLLPFTATADLPDRRAEKPPSVLPEVNQNYPPRACLDELSMHVRRTAVR